MIDSIPNRVVAVAPESAMLCPICSTELERHDKGIFECVKGDGTLVTGRYLADLDEPTQDGASEKPEGASLDTTHDVTCPHCSWKMHKVDYNHTGIMIDACMGCYYRWLDKGEIAKIQNFKPNIAPQDLLYIAGVDEKMRQKPDHSDPNPRLPLQGSYRAGAEIGEGLSGQSGRVRLGAIGGQGLYGIIKGLTHSKTSRYFTLATLLLIVIFFATIVYEYRDVLL